MGLENRKEEKMENGKRNTRVTIAGVEFKNPVMTASGTFGSGMEYSDFVDLNRLGAVVTMCPGRGIPRRGWRRFTVVCSMPSACRIPGLKYFWRGTFLSLSGLIPESL